MQKSTDMFTQGKGKCVLGVCTIGVPADVAVLVTLRGGGAAGVALRGAVAGAAGARGAALV